MRAVRPGLGERSAEGPDLVGPLSGGRVHAVVGDPWDPREPVDVREIGDAARAGKVLQLRAGRQVEVRASRGRSANSRNRGYNEADGPSPNSHPYPLANQPDGEPITWNVLSARFGAGVEGCRGLRDALAARRH